MKTFAFLSLAVLAHHAASQAYSRDPRTAKDCVAWADIEDASEDTCEKTMQYWAVEPKRFRAWNPSVGLDCKPWSSNTSYCVATNETINNGIYYTTATYTKDSYTLTIPYLSMTTDSDGWTIPVTKSDAVTKAYTTIPPIPSPSMWKDLGCYIDLWDDNQDGGGNYTWNLDYRYNPRDSAETVEKCKRKCWDIQYKIAGLKLGNECWCGDKNNATRADNQSDCNTPCVGDANVMCGGTQRFNIYAAEDGSTGGTLTTGSASSATATRTNAGGATTTASSSARRNRAFFGLF